MISWKTATAVNGYQFNVMVRLLDGQPLDGALTKCDKVTFNWRTNLERFARDNTRRRSVTISILVLRRQVDYLLQDDGLLGVDDDKDDDDLYGIKNQIFCWQRYWMKGGCQGQQICSFNWATRSRCIVPRIDALDSTVKWTTGQVEWHCGFDYKYLRIVWLSI